MDVVGEGITITGWVHPYSFSQNDARVISKSSTGATADGHWWMLSTLNGVNVRFRLKTNENSTTLTLIDTAVSWYGDGLAIGSADVDTVDAPGPFHVGKRQDNENFFPGTVDEVRVYDRALSAGEIASLAGRTGPVPIPFWHSDPDSDAAADAL